MTRRLALATAAATLFLLFVGGLVTTTESGDAVPDWWFLPISFGTLFPRMAGGVFYEHGHRLVATAVGLMTIALARVAWRSGERGLGRLGLAAVVAVCAQGILGGLRVHHVADPRIIAIVHACFAQIFFGLVVAIATLAAPGAPEAAPEPAPSRLPLVTALATAAVFVQIILGAVRRHTGWGLDLHLAFAFVVAVLVLVACVECLRRDRARRTATALAVLVFAQIALGFWAYALVKGGFVRSIHSPKLHMAVITLHLPLGGLVYALALSMAARAWRARGVGGAVPRRGGGASAE